MKRASPVELRKALSTAGLFAKHGVDFVCIPVLDQGDKINLTNQARFRMEQFLDQAEAEEAAQ